MNGENGAAYFQMTRLGWVEFEKEAVEVQDLRKMIDHSTGICGICLH